MFVNMADLSNYLVAVDLLSADFAAASKKTRNRSYVTNWTLHTASTFDVNKTATCNKTCIM